MGDLAWKQTAPDAEEATGHGGATFRVQGGIDDLWGCDVRILGFRAALEFGWPAMDSVEAKAECQRLADWASGTKREATRGPHE